MPTTELPNDDHVLRWAPYGKLHRDGETDEVKGLLHTAMVLRDGEDFLSVTWVEYFGRGAADNVDHAIRAFRSGMDKKPGARSAFGKARVGVVKDLCQECRNPVRVLHEPRELNQGHAGIHKYPRDNQDLFEMLAADAFGEIILNAEIPDV